MLGPCLLASENGSCRNLRCKDVIVVKLKLMFVSASRETLMGDVVNNVVLSSQYCRDAAVVIMLCTCVFEQGCVFCTTVCVCVCVVCVCVCM